MNTIDYKANAEKLIDDVDNILDEAGRDHFAEREGALALIEATRANALATLYLAEQQRIANLIAWWETNGRLAPESQEQIVNGLGL